MRRLIVILGGSILGAVVHAQPAAAACNFGGCPNWPSTCYNLKSTHWCPSGGVSNVSVRNLGSYESAFDWARAEISDPHNGVNNSVKLNQVTSGGQIKVYDYTGSADWWGLADQYVTSNGTCMTSARIQINKGYMTSTVRKQYTLLHEMGHTLGLNHVCVCPRTMNPCGTCGDDANGATPYLKTCDAQGIAALYPGDDNAIAPPVPAGVYQAHLYDDAAHSDLNGDGKNDVCARNSAGIRCYLAADFAVDIEGPGLSDDSGWGDSTNATTLRLLDMNGDGLADLCARANAGIRCWTSTGEGFSPVINGPEMSDDKSWDEPMYFSTLTAADFNGDGRDDLCARASTGFLCYPSDGAGFGEGVTGPTLSNESGWSAVEHYSTIRMGDVNGDGKADVCARAAGGMRCWLSDGNGFPTAIDGPPWSDEAGWDDVMYYSTIRLADVDGDQRADLCARAAAGYRCHLSLGDSFGDVSPGPTWSTESGWGDEDNYTTIRLGDIDGDHDLDVCARANSGIICARWEGTEFGPTFTGPELNDDKGWDLPEYYRTLRLADIDGDNKADLCARAGAGFGCWRSLDDGFDAFALGPAWSDDAGWDDPKYYATIRIAGMAAPIPEGTAPPPLGSSSGGTTGGGGANAQPPSVEDSEGGCNAGRGSRPSAWLLLMIALAAGRRRSISRAG